MAMERANGLIFRHHGLYSKHLKSRRGKHDQFVHTLARHMNHKEAFDLCLVDLSWTRSKGPKKGMIFANTSTRLEESEAMPLNPNGVNRR